MSDPTKVSTDANMSDANSVAGKVADGRLSDGELNMVHGGWGLLGTGPGSTAAVGKEKQAGLADQLADRHKNGVE